MIIGIINETSNYENRVAATPSSVKKFVLQGFEVWLETNAGLASGFSDSEYILAGAAIKTNFKDIVSASDILLMLYPSLLKKTKFLKNSVIIIGNFQHTALSNDLKKVTCFALEKLPRISKAQPFDILSSQDNLSGYQAIIKSTSMLKKSIPMMITSAGTIIPAKFLIIGLGVAGLQAIATAKRLGAKVYAHDIRPETKEQAKSLGSIFVDDFKEILPEIDVVISCAFSADKKAPLLIHKTDIKKMKEGSVLIDMAINNGGNIEGAQNMKSININNCQIYANGSLSNGIPQSASIFYSNNLSNFVDYLKISPDAPVKFDIKDDIIKATLI